MTFRFCWWSGGAAQKEVLMEKQATLSAPAFAEGAADREGPSSRSLGADIIIANAPDPVFVSDLEGKILQANDAVSELLGFRPDEVIEQSLSQFITRRRRASSPRLSGRSSPGGSRATPASTRAAPAVRRSRPRSTPPPCAIPTRT